MCRALFTLTMRSRAFHTGKHTMRKSRVWLFWGLSIALLFAATLYAQRRSNTSAPPAPASPQTSPSPSPSPTTPTAQDNSEEISEAEEQILVVKLFESETILQLSELNARLGKNRDLAAEKKVIEQVAEVYVKSPRNNKLANIAMSNAFQSYSEKPLQYIPRLLLLQAAQNQVLVEQNRKIIQLLERISKTRN